MRRIILTTTILTFPNMNHNKLFSALMSQRLPRWQERRTELNNFIAQAYPQDE